LNSEGIFKDLKEISVFKTMPDDIVEKFCRIAVIEEDTDGDIVYREGDASDALYIILGGEAFALKQIDAGKNEEKSICILSKGEFLGQIHGETDSVRIVTLKAKGALKVLKVSRAEMSTFLEEDPKTASQFLLEFIGSLFDILHLLTVEQIALYRTGRLIAASSSEEDFIREFVDIVESGAPSADSGFLAIYNSFTDEFEIRAGEDSEGNPFTKRVFTPNEPLIQHITTQRRFFEGNPSTDNHI
jgi:hypothetical protein